MEDFTRLAQHFDASLDRRLVPITDSVSAMGRNIEKIFDKLEALKDQIVSAEMDISDYRSRVDEHEHALEKCQESCKDKMKDMRVSGETTTKMKIELWIYRGVTFAAVGCLGYFIKHFLDSIAR